MDKTLSLFPLMMLIVLAGCSTTIKVSKSELRKINTIAVVSVYSNSTIYTGKKDKGDKVSTQTVMKALANTALKKTQIGKDLKGQQQATYQLLLRQTQQQAEHYFSGIEGWQLKPFEEFKNIPAFQELSKAKKRDGTMGKISSFLMDAVIGHDSDGWIIREGMPFLPLDRLAGHSFKKKMKRENGEWVEDFGGDFFSDDDSHNVRKDYANLCNILGVDAIAIVELDIANKGFLNLKFVNIYRPLTNAKVMVINKFGGPAVNGSNYKKKSTGGFIISPLVKKIWLSNPEGGAEKKYFKSAKVSQDKMYALLSEKLKEAGINTKSDQYVPTKVKAASSYSSSSKSGKHSATEYSNSKQGFRSAPNDEKIVFGKAQWNAEKAAKPYGCTSINVYLNQARGDTEVYDAYCKGGTHKITCVGQSCSVE